MPAALFLAAFAGGIRPAREGGAYARPAVWRGPYALLDLPRDVPHADAVRQAAAHRRLRFAIAEDTDNGWFVGGYSEHDVGRIRLGFAVLDPTRRRITLPAATDTDTDTDMC
ncbi:hypothetical protein ADL29_13950 [Streptomyces chattanoogensis]|uniref:Uncharacterized protein n=1 Tax=Streptomyces chattanoogensis TaxID=66876 RepID=A0A0N0XWJ4_9ACTN|nr:hypothetical protein ADL29_13950 [Streptomyces chattanoogensis]